MINKVSIKFIPTVGTLRDETLKNRSIDDLNFVIKENRFAITVVHNSSCSTLPAIVLDYTIPFCDCRTAAHAKASYIEKNACLWQ